MLGDVFSKVVEAVSEVARREEECRLVEDETEKMLSRRGGIDHLQVKRDSARMGIREGVCPWFSAFFLCQVALCILSSLVVCSNSFFQKARVFEHGRSEGKCKGAGRRGSSVLFCPALFLIVGSYDLERQACMNAHRFFARDQHPAEDVSSTLPRSWLARTITVDAIIAAGFQLIVVHLFCRGLVLVLAGHRPIQRVASPAPRGRFCLLLAYWRYEISLCTVDDPTQAAAHGVPVVAAAVGDFVRYCTS